MTSTNRVVALSLCLASAALTSDTSVVAIAHRGEHLRHPENTMAAYRAAADAGADFIEIDVRTTTDGKLVSMHDATVDARTNSTGAVKEMTFARIRALDAGSKFAPEFAGERVPSVDEILEFARGKTGVYVDAKQVSATDIVTALERWEMQDRAVIYGGFEFLKQVAALRPRMKVMPEAVSVPMIRRLLMELRPRVIAFGARDFTDDILGIAREARADIYVDRLGAADNPGMWQDAIDRGATGIQSDRPAELVQYLRAKGYRK